MRARDRCALGLQLVSDFEFGMRFGVWSSCRGLRRWFEKCSLMATEISNKNRGVSLYVQLISHVVFFSDSVRVAHECGVGGNRLRPKLLCQ